jgi:hypothetical protein
METRLFIIFVECDEKTLEKAGFALAFCAISLYNDTK